MERQRRHEADDALRHAFGGLGQAMMDVERRIGKLVEAAGEPEHLPIPFHPAHRCRRHACIAQFRQAHNTARCQEGVGNLALGDGYGH